ncbi:MAG TPA: hypothetical protein VFQ83_01510 [Candidatus Udaeobacter sp.]|jgi:hypothetical protein|nr:hypothetical protein [Candidatus Udaeobacter sp.]
MTLYFSSHAAGQFPIEVLWEFNFWKMYEQSSACWAKIKEIDKRFLRDGDFGLAGLVQFVAEKETRLNVMD